MCSEKIFFCTYSTKNRGLDIYVQSKKKNVILYLLIEFYVDLLHFLTRFGRQKNPLIDFKKSIS